MMYFINRLAGHVIGLPLGVLLLMLPLLLVGLPFRSVAALDKVCARVKIEIAQELTHERQGFEALIKINNPLESFTLEELAISLMFKNHQGQVVRASSDPNASNVPFFVRLYDQQGVNGLQDLGDGRVGSGQVAATSTASIKWLIIPAPGAAQDAEGTLYFIGADLQYRYGGQLQQLSVAEDSIVVKPLPQLTLDYFLTQEVFGDDAFTEVIEPVEPYTLGIRIANRGQGPARAVKLDSAQPKIVENKQGLAIGFNIASSYVDDQPAEPVLLLNFGDIPGGHNRVGRWQMETTLSGKFTEFKAKVSHAADLGGQLTSIIEGANTHFLIRDVQVDLPGRDAIGDFLAYPADADLSRLRVYESEPVNTATSGCLDCTAVALVTARLSGASNSALGRIHQLTPTQQTAGFGFIKIADPYRGQRVLAQVTRSDGRTLLARNAWLGRERNDDKVNFDHFIYVFDQQLPKQYQLRFVEASQSPQAPVIQFIADKVTREGGQVGFLVTASDPNGTIPTLTIAPLPLGAVFDLQPKAAEKISQGTFRWFPLAGQAGRYPLTVTATDGALQAQTNLTIHVKGPEDDKDDDSADTGEQPPTDGSGTDGSGGEGGPDGNGGGSDPNKGGQGPDATQTATVPLAPHILAPRMGAEVQDPNLSLVIINSAHRPDVAVTYDFELFADAALSEPPVERWSDIAEQAGTTELALTRLQQPLTEDHTYYWRVRAHSKLGYSLWQYGEFRFNAQNQAPKAAILSYPSEGTQVPTKRPVLSFYPAQDQDQEPVQHSIQVFQGDQQTPWLEIAEVPMKPGKTLGRWHLPRKLSDGLSYSWQVTATDSQGVTRVSDRAHFTYQAKRNALRDAPVIVSPTRQVPVQEASAWLRWVAAADSQALGLVYDVQWSPSFNFERNLQVVNPWPATVEPVQGLPIPVSHLENRSLYWRVRALQDGAASDWRHAQFPINAVNEPPAAPRLANPIDQAVVPSETPVLQLRAALDPDGDSLSYVFQLYQDAKLTQMMAEGSSDRPIWQVPKPLSEQQPYHWRAYAVDSEGERSPWSETGVFSVQKPQQAQPPQWHFITPQADLTVTEGAVSIQWVDDDPDSHARIRLWYESSHGDTGIIAEQLLEDQDDRFDQLQWHVSSLKPGTYTLKALIEDDQHRVEATAPGRVIVSAPPKAHLLRLDGKQAEPLDEAGNQSVQFSVALTQAPKKGPDGTAFVIIPLSLSDTSELRIQSVRQQGERQPQNYLYFNRKNWDQPYEITLVGKPDCMTDGMQSSDLVLGQASSTDPEFQGWNPPNATVLIADDQQSHAAVAVCALQLVDQSWSEDNQLIGQYRVSAMNHSQETLARVSAQAQARSPNIVVEEGLLHFNPLLPNQPVFSEDLLRLQSASGKPVALHQLRWDLQALPSAKDTQPPAVDNNVNPGGGPSTEANPPAASGSETTSDRNQSSQSDNKAGGAFCFLWTVLVLLMLPISSKRSQIF